MINNESRNKHWYEGILTWFNRYRRRITIGAGIILGLIFIASAVGKLVEPTDLINSLSRTSILPANLSAVLASVLPWAELVVGISLLLGVLLRFMSGISYLLIMGFIAQNILVIRRQLPADDCGCFGGLNDLLGVEKGITLSAQHALYMDIGMLVLSLLILFCYPGKLFTFKPWFWRGGKSQTAKTASIQNEKQGE